MLNKRKKKGENRKLGVAFIGPYRVMEQLGAHCYILTANGEEPAQHESRLKLY